MYNRQKTTNLPLFTGNNTTRSTHMISSRRLKRVSFIVLLVVLILAYKYFTTTNNWIFPTTTTTTTSDFKSDLILSKYLNVSEQAQLASILNTNMQAFKTFLNQPSQVLTQPIIQPEPVQSELKVQPESKPVVQQNQPKLTTKDQELIGNTSIEKLITDTKTNLNTNDPNTIYHHVLSKIQNLAAKSVNTTEFFTRSTRVGGLQPNPGTLEFQFLRRERGNYSPITDAIAPRSKPLDRKPGLLAMPVSVKVKDRVGPLLNKFLDQGFEIILFHYDLSDWTVSDKEVGVTHVRVLGQTKFWFAKRFLTPQVIENYNYVFLWDDDVFVYDLNWQPKAFVEILNKFQIHAAQPALRNGARTNYPQFNTVRLHGDNLQSGSPGRFSEFVEVMFPVFSREAWQNCIWETIPYDGRAYWGMDNVWYPHCSSMGYCRFAIIDSMPVDHMDSKSLDQNQRSNLQELSHYLTMYTGLCQNKVMHLTPTLSKRILHICNYMQHYPFGFSYRSIKSIDPNLMDTSTCAEPDLWPSIENFKMD